MGHIRLGLLPRTRKWDQVVALIAGDGDAAEIASATLDAASKEFAAAVEDEGVAQTVWLLIQLPLAARSSDYVHRLRQLEIDVHTPPSVFQLVAAFTESIDRHMRHAGARSDVGEMAQLAAAEAITSALASRSGNLFGETSEDVRKELGRLATTKRFSVLARDYFSRFTRRYLAFFLSRELSNHVGAGRRFANVGEHTQFNDAIELHCRQASRIVEEFAGSWLSKNQWQGGITPDKARNFTAVALKKIQSELMRDQGGKE